MATFAKGLEGVIANSSALSNVEGLEGRLSYLGYSIDDLVAHCCFEEVIYLLHKSELPTRAQLEEFETQLRSQRSLPKAVVDFLRSAPSDAPPMDVLRTGVSMLGLYDTRGKDQDRTLNEERALSI
nr:citrate synthase [Akkermansiaceae bacterium]